MSGLGELVSDHHHLVVRLDDHAGVAHGLEQTMAPVASRALCGRGYTGGSASSLHFTIEVFLSSSKKCLNVLTAQRFQPSQEHLFQKLGWGWEMTIRGGPRSHIKKTCTHTHVHTNTPPEKWEEPLRHSKNNNL